jgi:OmpA-OmpF porin, OOP family
MRGIGVALAGAMLLSTAAAGAAEQGRGYVAGAIGLSALQDVDADSNTFLARIDTKTEGSIAVAVGRYFSDWLRGELEFSYASHDADSISGAAGNGDVTGLSFGGNMVVDFHLPDTKITPYAGLGVGMIRVNLDTVSPVGGSILDDSATVPYIQAIAGASYALSERLSAFGDVRFRGSQRLDMTTRAGAAVSPNYSDQRVMIGLRLKFPAPKMAQVAAAPPPQPPPQPAPKVEAPPPPVVAPAPAPAPQEQVAEVPREYLVFFDWDRADITAEADQIIRAAADNAKKVGSVRIATTGHADRSGPDAYNLGLSLRRAEAVRAVLVRQGIAAQEIEIFARGESEPLVPTPDGVREPRNRRVQVILN